jgi:hypothetical protein
MKFLGPARLKIIPLFVSPNPFVPSRLPGEIDTSFERPAVAAHPLRLVS